MKHKSLIFVTSEQKSSQSLVKFIFLFLFCFFFWYMTQLKLFYITKNSSHSVLRNVCISHPHGLRVFGISRHFGRKPVWTPLKLWGFFSSSELQHQQRRVQVRVERCCTPCALSKCAFVLYYDEDGCCCCCCHFYSSNYYYYYY